ncbi:hypothetical protein LR48_Vigan06g108300 [Vigna angularis]|uniref:Uncharacterized protein n=1 Tax=Phaseolus angularis TaxID=3914 RepID=A0A0L9UT66_PHAAN|nr:hypothetical protein LR48_Vigan06g108300 [Vigna angularis]
MKNRNWTRLPFLIALIRLCRDLIRKEIAVRTTRCWNHGGGLGHRDEHRYASRDVVGFSYRLGTLSLELFNVRKSDRSITMVPMFTTPWNLPDIVGARRRCLGVFMEKKVLSGGVRGEEGAVWGCSWRGRCCLGVFVEKKESSHEEEEENCSYEKSERGLYASVPLHNRGNSPFSKSLSDEKSDLHKREEISIGLYASVPPQPRHISSQ